MVKTRSCLVFTWRARRSVMANTTWLKLAINDVNDIHDFSKYLYFLAMGICIDGLAEWSLLVYL